LTISNRFDLPASLPWTCLSPGRRSKKFRAKIPDLVV
jgi:hypothetical protein